VQVVVGNEPPVVKAEVIDGNKTFYFPNTGVKYAVAVTDKEDGSTADGKISAESITVTRQRSRILVKIEYLDISRPNAPPSAEYPSQPPSTTLTT
jgi:cytochrome c